MINNDQLAEQVYELSLSNTLLKDKLETLCAEIANLATTIENLDSGIRYLSQEVSSKGD